MNIKIEDKELDFEDALIIGCNKDEANILVTPSTDMDKAFRLLHTLSLHLLNAYTVAANEGPLKKGATKKELNKFTAIKKHIYNKYNEAVSSVLELYGPEFELRPDVTTEAINRCEEEIINERFDKLNRKDRRSLPKVVSKAKKSVKNN